MVTTASQMGGNVGEEVNRRKKSNAELVLQRRKANSPTIEDDFTVDLDDEDEPFDEPRSTPTAASMKAAETKNKVKNGDDKADVDAEIDMLCWTKSDLDGENEKDEEHKSGVEDKSKSLRSIVWSGSELDDVNDVNEEQRDDFVNAQENMESREESANPFNNAVDDSMRAVLMMEKNSVRNEDHGQHHNGDKNGQRKANVQFHLKSEAKEDGKAQPAVHSDRKATTSGHYEDVAVRAERSTDSEMEEEEPNDYVGDEQSAFSVTPSMAPSVAVSVTKRTRNTRYPNSKSPKSPKSAFRAMNDDAETTMTGQSTVMTADIEAGMTATCSMRRTKKVKGKDGKTKTDGDEDLLDRFFENVESQVCKTPKHGDAIPERTRDKGPMNPFLEKLKKFDSVFEQLEGIACPKEGKRDDESVHKKIRTNPAAFAAAKFTQLLDQIEKFDPCLVKAKATACTNIYDNSAEGDSEDDECNNDDKEATQSTDRSNKESSANDSPHDVLEKAYQRAETMVKDQKRTSFDTKDQLQKMKEQWFAARLNWKLRQSILAKAVKENTAKAAETTTKCVDTMVSSCHPFMSSAATATVDKKDKKKKSRSSEKEVNNGYDSESDAYHDALSVDNSDFFNSDVFSMMTPSDHSNINSKHGGFRSSISSPSEHSNVHSKHGSFRSNILSSSERSSAFMSDSECLSPSSRNGDSIADVVSNGPSDEERKDDGVTNVVATIGVSTGPLAIITEEGSINSDHTLKRIATKEKDSTSTPRQLGNSAPSYCTEYTDHSRGSEMPSTPKEWLEKWKTTVVFHSERILDKAQCASASINLADSNSFEDDQDGNEGAKKHSGRDSTRNSASQRVKQKNSIIEDEDNSVSVIVAPEKKDGREQHFEESSLCYEDDLSGFETAVQDERPPMLRLQKSRNDSKSIGSRDGSNGGSRDGSHDGIDSNKLGSMGGSSVHSRLSTEVPEGYTLADSIRHASLSTMNNGANRTRMSQEPRGNKLKKDPSTHVRSRHLPSHPLPPTAPKLLKQDPDLNAKYQQQIRSPRSSETHDTSVMTAVTNSSSDLGVTKMADSTHSKRSMVIHVENTETIQHQPSVDEDCDKETVFSYNTTSTGSTEFKDCYQDAIPSMSTMGTVLEDEVAPKNVAHKENMLEIIPDNTTFLPSNENILKSMALLSVSATVLKMTADNSNRDEYDEYEVESMPSTRSYPEEEIVEEAIVEEAIVEDVTVEENKDSEALFNDLESVPSTQSYPEEAIVDEAIVEDVTVEENKDSEASSNELESVPSTQSYPEKAIVEDVTVEDVTVEEAIAEEAIVEEAIVEEAIVEDVTVEENKDSKALFNELESEPSTQSYPEEAIVEEVIVEENRDSEQLLSELLEKEESKASPPTFDDNNHEVEDSCYVEEKIIRNPMIDLDENSELEQVDQEVDANIAENIRFEEDVVDDSIMAGSKEIYQMYNEFRLDNSVEDICFEKDLKKESVIDQLVELETVSSDEFILESLKQQESLNEQESFKQQEFEPIDDDECPIMTEPPKQEIVVEARKLQGFALAEDDEAKVKMTLTTQKLSSKLREPRTVEDRRRRRLRQNRKWEKVLRGEADDSSSTMSSTMSGGVAFTDNGGPLISASFDTGFGAVPEVDESECQ